MPRIVREAGPVMHPDLDEHERLPMSGSANEEPRTGEVTSLLAAWREGDSAALDEVVRLVYEELRRMARLRARHDRAARALQPTAVVHEVYLRLVNLGRLLLC